MAEGESRPTHRTCRTVPLRHTLHPGPDTLAFDDTLVVVVVAERSQSDTDTSSDVRIEPEWPQRLPVGWQRHTGAAGEDGEERTASGRPAVRTDSRSSWSDRTAAGEQSPADTVDNRPVSCSLPRSCKMAVAVRAREFGCSHIADMRLVEPHHTDNHYLLCCSCFLGLFALLLLLLTCKFVTIYNF